MRTALFAMVTTLLACASGALDESNSAVDAQDEDPSEGRQIESSEDETEPPPQAKPKKNKDASASEEESCSSEECGTSTPPPPPPPKKPTTPTPGTAKCVSQIVGHTSETSISYMNTNGNISILFMTTVVTNAYGLDLNDLSVFVKPAGATTFGAAVYASGDILGHGQTVSTKLPSNVPLSAGDTLRIDTSFDMLWVPDPSASCVVTF